MAHWRRLKSSVPWLSAWEESLWARNLRPDTIYRYLKATGDLIEFADAQEEPSDWAQLVELIPAYLKSLAAIGRAPSTIEARAQRLQRFGRWVHDGAPMREAGAIATTHGSADRGFAFREIAAGEAADEYFFHRDSLDAGLNIARLLGEESPRFLKAPGAGAEEPVPLLGWDSPAEEVPQGENR